MITFEQITNHFTEKVTLDNLNKKKISGYQQGILKNIEGLKSTDKDYEVKFNNYVSEFYNNNNNDDLFSKETYQAKNSEEREQILTIIQPVVRIIKSPAAETKKEKPEEADLFENYFEGVDKTVSSKKNSSAAKEDEPASKRGSEDKDDDFLFSEILDFEDKTPKKGSRDDVSSFPESLSEEQILELKATLENNIREISIFSKEFRATLMSLVEANPQLLVRLQNPDTLSLFVKKNSPQNLQRLEEFLGARDTQALQKENERLANFEAIFNPAIARGLAKIPNLSLSSQEVDQINEVLSKYAQESALSEEEFTQLLQKVAAAAGHKVSYKLFKDYLNKDEVSAHQFNNKFFFKSYQKAKAEGDEFSKRLIAFYLTSPKKDSLREDSVAKLLEEFENSSSREAFLHQLAVTNVQDFFLRPISNLITPTLYNELKTLQHQGKLLNPATYENVLTLRRGEMEQRNERIKPIIDANKGLFKSIGKNLKFLADLKEIPWANPVFQATSQQLAHKWSKSFTLLAEDCKSIVEELTEQRNALILARNELPKRNDLDNDYLKSDEPEEQEQGRQILDYGVKVFQQLKIVEKELKLYKKVLEKLEGNPESPDPLLQQGIVALLKKAKERSVDIQFHPFSTSIRDVSTEHLREELSKEEALEAEEGISGHTTLEIEGDRALYSETAPLKDGFTRIHTLRSDSLTGRFLETRSPSHLALQPNAKGKVEAISKVKYEIDEFPTYPRDEAQRNAPLEPSAQQEQDKARLKLAIKMATDALGSLNGPPTEKKPIIIYGDKEEELQFLWTALMIIGKHDPHMKFGAEAIKVNSSDFNPASEMKGSFLGLGKNRMAETSLYHRLELEHDLENFCAAIKQVNEAKFSPKACREGAKVVENVEKVTNVYKDKLRTTIDQIASQNKPRPAPRSLSQDGDEILRDDKSESSSPGPK